MASARPDDPLSGPSAAESQREVQKIKEQANDKFKTGDFFSAKCLYSGALELLERCCLQDPKADELWEGIKNNMALCDLKRKEWSRVVDLTTEVLARNSNNPKALYRRAMARLGQGKFTEAQQDLKACLKLEPNNKEARQRLQEVVAQCREASNAEKQQAEKLRGFLQGERLEDSVPISQDGSVRKLHGNENAPLFATWMRREWLEPSSSTLPVVTCHVAFKTAGGKEIWSSRKPPAHSRQEAGPHLMTQPAPVEKPIEPVRFVLHSICDGVFRAWMDAAKTLQLQELGHFEASREALGASVEAAIERCVEKSLPDCPERARTFGSLPEDMQKVARRKQALQILGLPEELCLDPSSAELAGSLRMEMELLAVDTFERLDERTLMSVIREGSKDGALAKDFSKVKAHFRVAKLLLNSSLKDTRLGLASKGDSVILRPDSSREPMTFIIGEEDLGENEGSFVPPFVGRSLLLPPGGAREGMRFELIFLDGLPVSEMDRSIQAAYASGDINPKVMPDTTGPVVVRIELEKVEHDSDEFKGLREERERAEFLEKTENGRHWQKALRRRRRSLRHLRKCLEARRGRLSGIAAGEEAATKNEAGGASLYDFDWGDEEPEENEISSMSSPPPGQAKAVSSSAPPPSSSDHPDDPDASVAGSKSELHRDVDEKKGDGDMEVGLDGITVELLKQFDNDELEEWASAHAAVGRLLVSESAIEASLGSPDQAERHLKKCLEALQVGTSPKDLEVSARLSLAKLLTERGRAQEALEILKPAVQELAPGDAAVKDQWARSSQLDNEQKARDVKGTLQQAKEDLAKAIEAQDKANTLAILERIEALPLTWEAVSATAVGKQIGTCTKSDDPATAALAQRLIGLLHRLAKQERPLWVR